MVDLITDRISGEMRCSQQKSILRDVKVLPITVLPWYEAFLWTPSYRKEGMVRGEKGGGCGSGMDR